MATLGDLVVNLLGNAQPLQQTFAKGQQLVSSFVASAQSTLGGLAATLSGTLGAGLSLAAAQGDITAQAKLEAVLRATGSAAGVAAGEIAEFASQRQAVTNFADDATVGAAAILATFKNIRGDTFKGALVAAQDLSALKDQDLPSSITAIGKALSNPAEGLAALEKATGKFTDEQRSLIESLARSGHELEAQGLILDVLKSKIGGVAEATSDPISKLKLAIGDIGEEVGRAILPFVQALADRVIPFFQEWGGWIGKATAALLGTVAALRAVAIAQAFIQAVSGPAGWAKLAIGIGLVTAATLSLDSALGKVQANTEAVQRKMAAVGGSGRGVFSLGSTRDFDDFEKQIREFRGHIDRIRNAQDIGFTGAADRALTPIAESLKTARLLAPPLSEAESTIRRLHKMLADIGSTADIVGAAAAEKLAAPLRERIGDMTGISQAIRAAEVEGQKLAGTFDAIGDALARFPKAAPEQLAKLQGILRENEKGPPPLKTFGEAMVDLDTRIADARSGLGEFAKIVRELEGKKLAPDLLEKFKDKIQELKDVTAADALKKGVETPLDQLRDKLLEINRLLAKGLITDDVAHAATDKAQQEFLAASQHGSGGNRYAAGAEKDTSAAYSQILASLPGVSNANAEQKQIAKEAVKEAKKQTALLQKIGALPQAPPVNIMAGGPL